MIDREARGMAVEAIQALMSGAISNKEYERRYPRAKADPAIWGIYSQIWFLYSDMSEHRLTGAHALIDGDRVILDRCILFLKGNPEFRWRGGILHKLFPILRLLGLGRLFEKRLDVQTGAGDQDVWPFFTKAEYEATRKSGTARNG